MDYLIVTGDIHIYVSEDGSIYRVYFGDEYHEYSAVDTDNRREIL